MTTGDKGKLFILFVPLFTLSTQQDCVFPVHTPINLSTVNFLFDRGHHIFTCDDISFLSIWYPSVFQWCLYNKSSWTREEKFRIYKHRCIPLMTSLLVLSGLHTANLSWQTRVGKLKLVCVNGIKTVGKHVSIWRPQFANVFATCFCAVHTHQLGFANTDEFANLSLPCEGRLSMFFKSFFAHHLLDLFGNYPYHRS